MGMALGGLQKLAVPQFRQTGHAGKDGLCAAAPSVAGCKRSRLLMAAVLSMSTVAAGRDNEEWVSCAGHYFMGKLVEPLHKLTVLLDRQQGGEAPPGAACRLRAGCFPRACLAKR